MREKRTDTDFSKHEMKISKGDQMSVYSLEIPGRHEKSVTFINTHGVLVVTGDYGYWIFCREFHPGPNEYVSDRYWVEKLRINSTQDPYTFDPEEAQRQIKELLGIPDHCTTPEERERLEKLQISTKEDIERLLQDSKDTLSPEDIELLGEILLECTEYSVEEREWLHQLSDAANEGEYTYIAKAMDRPYTFEAEMIPRGKTLNYWLVCIFDAFDELCQRIEDSKK